jgi:hypothetical protein
MELRVDESHPTSSRGGTGTAEEGALNHGGEASGWGWPGTIKDDDENGAGDAGPGVLGAPSCTVGAADGDIDDTEAEENRPVGGGEYRGNESIEGGAARCAREDE